MSLEQRISKGIMEAMKAKDTVRLSALRNAKKYIIEAKTSGPEIAELPDADVLKIVSKLAKQGDGFGGYLHGAEPPLIWRRRNWLRWPSIRSFCPGSSRPRSLTAEVQALIAETGASSLREMGKVMGLASKRLAGRADGKRHFGQGPRAAGLIRSCPQGFAATADVPGRRIAGPVFRRRAVVRRPSGKRPCRIRNAANEIDICTYSNRCTAM